MTPQGPIHINPKHKNLLHADLGVPSDQPIPLATLLKAEHSRNPKLRRRAQFADNARKWNHE